MNTCELLKKGAILVDVRSKNEFISGSLPNAINLPLSDITTTQTQFDKDDVIILYCVTGARSGSALGKLTSLGFDNVHDLGSFRNYNCD